MPLAELFYIYLYKCKQNECIFIPVLSQFSPNHVLPMKVEFYEKLNQLISRRKSNSVYLMDSVRYRDFINEVKEVKSKESKTFEDYKMLANYDVLCVNGRERLVLPNQVCSHPKFYVSTEELFGVLHTMHLLFQHADKEVMKKQINVTYCNVSGEVIKIYMACCKKCNENKS